MRQSAWMAVGAVLMFLLAACGGTRIAEPTTSIGRLDDSTLVPVSGLPVAELRVFRSAPERAPIRDVWIVMAGTGRNADEYRDHWSQIVAGTADLILAPEFSEEDFPGSAGYNLANMVDSQGRPNPSDEWLYGAIDEVFAAAQAEFNLSAQTGYRLFGHSAGAQFVTRMVTFHPVGRMCQAFAANAGWYTVTDEDIDFPYGLRDSPPPGADLAAAFATPLRILLGEEDTDDDDPSLRRDPDADRQGTDRLERGEYYFATAQVTAAERGEPFRWTKEYAPGIAHDGAAMSRVAFESARNDPECRFS